MFLWAYYLAFAKNPPPYLHTYFWMLLMILAPLQSRVLEMIAEQSEAIAVRRQGPEQLSCKSSWLGRGPLLQLGKAKETPSTYFDWKSEYVVPAENTYWQCTAGFYNNIFWGKGWFSFIWKHCPSKLFIYPNWLFCTNNSQSFHKNISMFVEQHQFFNNFWQFIGSKLMISVKVWRDGVSAGFLLGMLLFLFCCYIIVPCLVKTFYGWW